MNRTEEFLAEIIDVITSKYDKQAILRGGMVLRILGCERFTNDVDYVFVPFASKKDIAEELVKTLKEIPRVSVSHSMHSTCLRVVLKRGQVSAQVEAKVAMEMPIAVLSNSGFAKSFGLQPRLLAVVDYEVALADKMGAWNERRLMRDLYDIWFYLRMGIRPDAATLEKRLLKPSYSKAVNKNDYFIGAGKDDFYSFLRESVKGLEDGDYIHELSDYLPPANMTGLAMRVRAEVAKLG